MTPSARRVVCVLGMHRSGTSLAASLVESLGVYLGETADLFDPLPDGPRTYWEHRALRNLNEVLLARLNGRWYEPPVLRRGWEHAPHLEDVRSGARAVMRERFATQALWGWKDPRTCLTLPFWAPLLSDPHYVVCLRNPLEVARSLEARDGFSLAHGLRLWLAYTAAALAHSAASPRVLVFYDDALQEPSGTASALAAFVGRPERPVRAAVERVRPERQHHQSSALALMTHAGCPAPVSSLYLTLRSLAPRPGVLAPGAEAAVNDAAVAAVAAQGAADAVARPASRARRAAPPTCWDPPAPTGMARALSAAMRRARRLLERSVQGQLR